MAYYLNPESRKKILDQFHVNFHADDTFNINRNSLVKHLQDSWMFFCPELDAKDIFFAQRVPEKWLVKMNGMRITVRSFEKFYGVNTIGPLGLLSESELSRVDGYYLDDLDKVGLQVFYPNIAGLNRYAAVALEVDGSKLDHLDEQHKENAAFIKFYTSKLEDWNTLFVSLRQHLSIALRRERTLSKAILSNPDLMNDVRRYLNTEIIASHMYEFSLVSKMAGEES